MSKVMNQSLKRLLKIWRLSHRSKRAQQVAQQVAQRVVQRVVQLNADK